MTSTFKSPEKVLGNFLGGIFHQDIDSPEQALAEYMQEETKEYMRRLIESTETFLGSNRPEQEKTDFIESKTQLYFPAIGMAPIEWLQNVLSQLKEAMSHKG